MQFYMLWDSETQEYIRTPDSYRSSKNPSYRVYTNLTTAKNARANLYLYDQSEGTKHPYRKLAKEEKFIRVEIHERTYPNHIKVIP